jgi:O-antigen ligase
MPERWIRWGCAASVLLILAGITVSGSRGGAVGLIVTVLMMIWNSKRRVRASILVAALGVAFLLVSPTSPLKRLLHPSAGDQSAADTRIVLWHAAWNMFRDNPVIGVGYGNWRYAAPKYLDGAEPGETFLPHNQYLEVLAEMGVPGLLAYAGMYVGSFVVLKRVRRDLKRGRPRILADAALGIQIGLFGYAVSVFFLSAQFLKLFWFMLAISASMPALIDSTAVQSSRPDDPQEEEFGTEATNLDGSN